jgi:hypothetical protein
MRYPASEKVEFIRIVEPRAGASHAGEARYPERHRQEQNFEGGACRHQALHRPVHAVDRGAPRDEARLRKSSNPSPEALR